MAQTTRQIVLDTETTGIRTEDGHRIIEIGCVELIDRRFTGNNYHVYLNPERVVEQGAIDVHGITNEFLQDKPVFAQVVAEFLEYIKGAQLVIHNAPFDVGFLNYELSKLAGDWGQVADYATVFDTLSDARQRFPGQRNSLDALCKRFDIDNSHRTLHGALLDAEILADVYLLMTGGQHKLGLANNSQQQQQRPRNDLSERQPTPVILPNEAEEEAHQAYLQKLAGESENCFWLKAEQTDSAN